MEEPLELESILIRNEHIPPTPRVEGECYPSTSRAMFPKKQTTNPQQSLLRAEGSGDVSRAVRASVKVESVEEPQLAHHATRACQGQMMIPQQSVLRVERSGDMSRTVRVSVKVESVEEPELAPDGTRACQESTRGNSYVPNFGYDTWDHTYAKMDFPSIGVCVKQEPEPNELADLIKEEPESNDEVCVEAQPLASAGSRVSEAAMTRLYADHVVKDELVLGPEGPYRPHITLFHDRRPRESGGGQPALKDCSVRLERCDAPRGATIREPAPASQPPSGHHTAPQTRTDQLVTNTYVCDICGKLIKRKDHLIRHINMHLRENAEVLSIKSNIYERVRTSEKPYACKICKKEFSRLDNLQRHQRVHTGDKPHSCKICKKTFAELCNLKAHKRIHTGERPYSCDICQMQFAEIRTLKKHKRTHTGEKSYSCEICKKAFGCFTSLKRHKLIHTGARPYLCEICEEGFMRLDTLKIHLKSHMGGKSEAKKRKYRRQHKHNNHKQNCHN